MNFLEVIRMQKKIDIEGGEKVQYFLYCFNCKKQDWLRKMWYITLEY